jgi:hypothetical protein
MKVNVSNCAKVSHLLNGDGWRTFLGRCIQFRGENIPTLKTAEYVRYLGEPTAARRNAKLKSVKFRLREMEVLLGKIMASSLLKVQKIDVVKAFLLSSIDFLLLNEEAGIKHLQGIERKIRLMIMEDQKISVECRHASWRDGGLSHSSVQDRGDVFTICQFAQMALS